MRFDAAKISPSDPPRRWLFVVIVLMLVLVVMPAGVLWYGLSARPDYWQPIDRARPEVRAAAERFEQAMREQVRPAAAPPTQTAVQTPAPATPVLSEPSEWTVEVTQEQLNTWLAVRVTEWGANRGVHPRVLELMSRSMISIDLDAIEVALPFTRASISGVILLRYRPVVGEDKRVRLVAQDAHAGIAPVPIAMALDSILAHVPRGQEGEVESLRRRARSLDLLIPLRDGRTISVVDMALLPGKTVLTLRVHNG